MNMEIILSDDNGQPVLRLRNCHQPELANIAFIDEILDNVEVNIEDLRLALRKINAK